MEIPPLLSPTLPRFHPNRSHQRNASRSPTRERFTDDILADLLPATTLEAFTNPSGKLKASIEAASPSERAFGIRATLASKKIQEWLNELSNWPWPADGGSVGFEMPVTKRRRTLDHERMTWNSSDHERHGSRLPEEEEYMGSLLAEEVDRYDVRVEEITEDMEDLDVEAIKRQVLDEHFSLKSQPSSAIPSSSPDPIPSLISSYTRMDDFTAIITATVLHALPNLSKLMRLMEVWKIRLIILKKIPPLLYDLDEAEAALISGWDVLGKSVYDEGQDTTNEVFLLSRVTLGTMQHVLQNRVTSLGRDLDYLLDTLEGREDTLPDIWLDRMETIEQDYGEWVVSGDQKVRQGEWDSMTKARAAAEEARKLQDEQATLKARKSAEDDAKRAEARLKKEQAAQELENARGKVEVDYLDSHVLEEEAAKLVPLPASPAGNCFPPLSSSEVMLQHGEEPLPTGVRELLTSDALKSTEAVLASDSACIVGVATDDADSLACEYTSGVTGTLDQRHAELGKSPEFPTVPPKSEINALEVYPNAISPAPTSAFIADKAHLLPKATDTTVTPDCLVTDLRKKNAAWRTFPMDESQSVDNIRDALSFSTSDFIPAQPTVNAEPVAGKPTPIMDDIRSQHIPGSSPSPSDASSSSPKRVSKFRPETQGMRRLDPELPNEDLILAQLDGSLDLPTALSPTLERHDENPTLTLDQDIAPPTGTLGDWSMVDSFKGQQQVKSKSSSSGESQTSMLYRRASKRHNRNVSIVNSSSLALPAFEVAGQDQSAQFQPILSSIKSIESLGSHQGSHAKDSKRSDTLIENRDQSPEVYSAPVLSDLSSDVVELSTVPQLPGTSGEPLTRPILLGKNFTEEAASDHDASNCNNVSVRSSTNSTDPNATPRRPSVIQLDTARRDSVDSDTPTVSMRWAKWPDPASATPKVDANEMPDISEKSPTAGRIGLRISHTRSSSSPPSSPPSLETASKHGSVTSPTSPTFSLSDRSDASTISEAPMFEDIELRSLPPSSPKKDSRDQLQQHISSLLETIPASIRLTSEPDVNSSLNLKPKKTRRSVTPSFRSSSSLGSRGGAQTPSFLLAPAYNKTPSRQRPQTAHPDIKVYHLSRSTGESPIKLFVRLVGMKGERVMVRVGGGWADLGEYLTEYASHHGRRSTVETDKVEIQDLPPRIVSSSSTASTATVRGSESGRSTPVPAFRPSSALDRPVSSLNVRKMRKSLGERTFNEIQGYRSPSTPLPNRRSIGETAPSVITTAVRSSSRMSWTEDDISLGLAGPKGKRVTISEKDQEWVDSMKEKVKQASAEKDRGKEKERRLKERGKSFGELEKVGGTKRLFRKL